VLLWLYCCVLSRFPYITGSRLTIDTMAIKNVGFVVFFLGLVARSIFWNVRNLVLSNDEIIHDQDLLLDPSPDLHRPRIKNARKRLLLTVPFYVYEELAWLNATYDRVPVKDWITSPRINKHSNDYWFAKASLDHPLRTMDPSKAKLFVVPILMNTFDSNELRRRICWNKMCNKKLLSYAGELLNHSPWFQNSSHLHIVTTSQSVFWITKSFLVLSNLTLFFLIILQLCT
jgi:hypothetical protein